VKLGARKYLVISIVMIASVIEIREKRVERARIAIGACSAIACRLPALEAELAGRPLDCSLAEAVRAEHLSPLTRSTICAPARPIGVARPSFCCADP